MMAPNRCVHILILEPVNVPLLVKRACADVIKNLEMRQSSGLSGCTLNSMTSVFLRESERDLTQTEEEEAEIGGMRPQTKEDATARSWKRRGAQPPLAGSVAPPGSSRQTFVLQDGERTRFCCRRVTKLW